MSAHTNFTFYTVYVTFERRGSYRVRSYEHQYLHLYVYVNVSHIGSLVSMELLHIGPRNVDPVRSVSASETVPWTKSASSPATVPVETPDLRPQATAVPRAIQNEGHDAMIILVAVVAAIIVIAIILTIVIVRVRSARKQVYPENDFEEKKPGPAFVPRNIHAVNVVLP
jgi:hypothetical protein